MAGDDDHAIVRRRAGVQRRHRALHADAEGAVPLSPSASRRSPRRSGSSASSSRATTPSGSSSGSAIRTPVAARTAATGGVMMLTLKRDRSVAPGSTIEGGALYLISPSRVQKPGAVHFQSEGRGFESHTAHQKLQELRRLHRPRPTLALGLRRAPDFRSEEHVVETATAARR